MQVIRQDNHGIDSECVRALHCTKSGSQCIDFVDQQVVPMPLGQIYREKPCSAGQ
jgi:hypothetical protein